ncbi:ribonuclease H-like domain-containing protein [Tanacetum coccineum]|uniref:Ribonuclease H-like domain-containing protein n=1 Tax=Tanacetum coccineum TaxID=301880 RepID=A0ABQ5GWJ0_9ASTR
MSVHNSLHNSPVNSDRDDDYVQDPDPVTRISKLDISDPLHLHPNDTTALTVVSIKLKGTENYQVWSCAILLALEGKNKTGFIDGTSKRSNTDEILGKQWDMVNATVLGWILNSISEELFLGHIFFKKAKHVWEELKETYDKVDGSIMFGLHHQIGTLKQNSSSIADYYHKLNALWKQYDDMIELPKCVCNASESFKKHNQLVKLIQFLMGLNDSYLQIKSSILSREVLPDVRSAYATISSKETHRVAASSIGDSSKRNQASAFVSNVPYRQNIQKNNQNNSSGPLRPNNLNNNRQSGGYPADFEKKKSGQNFKKQNVSNINSVGKSSYSRPIWQGQINMTYTDKELDNVLDISHLRIKVGHPNGTEAYISKIRNLRLSNGLTLYDVTVIPEYCVTLISVHKSAKENKVIVAFDENRYYFLNQDLNLKNILRIGDQCKGLYYYNNQDIKSNNSTLRYQCLLSQHDWHCRLGHPSEHVLNVLKDSLQIDKKDNIGCCEICERAKQTRKHFPLSDHTSKCLGDLIHLDLCGPYKVTSYEGFKYFFTVMDDYTRAVWVYLIKSKDEDSEVEKNDSTNVFQDINHINFFDIEYPEIPNDDEIVANDLNKGKSDSSSSSVSGSNINTADFSVDSGNDADSSDGLVTTQNEEVATLEENIFSEGNLDQNPSSSQGVQNVRRSPRQSVFPRNYKYFVVESKVKYEMNALLRNGTWEMVELPEGRKAIGSKWIYKIKFRSSGEIDRYKARLVAQGFGQKEGIDYEEIFSPVVKMEVVYMKPPEGYFPSDNNVCRLKKSLYGLKQAPRQWNAKLTSTLIENGFSQSKSDYSLYTISDKGVFLALLVYVNDIIITGNSVFEIEKFKVYLKSKFMIKDLGKLKYFLGIKVVDTDKGICLNQRKYVLDLLSEYGMLACKHAKTPLMSKLVISNEASEKDPLLENITDYQKFIGKLIYLTNTTPDISYVVHCLSRFMHSPLTSHRKIAFKILRFLKSCPGLGIHITKTSGMFLNAYSDADWAKCIVTRKSVTGYCVFLNNFFVSWKSKKQNTLSKSSTEAEYRALASVTSDVIWILNILKDLQIEKLLPVSLHCDSNLAIKIAANLVFH